MTQPPVPPVPQQASVAAPAQFDAIVLGAGAAGLFCAAQAGQRGLKVLLIDHARRLAEKIRISGGGRCNFTNRDLDVRAPQRHFISENPHFCRSALSRFTPQDFMALLQQHGIGFHEKHKGQLFCDQGAQQIIDMLRRLCEQAGVQLWQGCEVQGVEQLSQPAEPRYAVRTARGQAQAAQLVVATGGLSIPKIGASDLGHRIAGQFGLPLAPCRPGLVPLTFAAADWAAYATLAGLAVPVTIGLAGAASVAGAAGGKGRAAAAPVFHEDLLFTHRGLSGPAILQISSYWQPGQALQINWLPGLDVPQALQEAKRSSRRLLGNVLAQWLPARLADALLAQQPQWQRPIDQVGDKALQALAEQLTQWRITPSGTEGYAKAEVTIGGVDTRALSSKTMQSAAHPGLFFIGEVLDVTGWLGGYNFQWAWASAHACAQALEKTSPAQPQAL
ncbi:NAD(P)/FAD-dependent oxidoreductase [Vandammella animalimorsus]|uniref:NAD(P)/FAD-dependent oxidoreductase n=1 Tax=Vandammella animalimorsus TaxID=2029117 RepID=A0A3M6RIY7_9BURK|nr:NAD(P)/FAD-dependent oxidoreductase [Vandammella animalimorsus]RMX15260.1 NAD(P)/FAD-dependent oxidoreductase [Vandammella animalimorsus]